MGDRARTLPLTARGIHFIHGESPLDAVQHAMLYLLAASPGRAPSRVGHAEEIEASVAA